MNIEDLGVQVEEMHYRHEYHLYKVTADGVSAVIIEKGGKYQVSRLNVNMPVTGPFFHDSMESALEEIRSYDPR